jgi:hypothetical protein
MKRLWFILRYLDCWITDKWTGRGWEYYSAVLGDKEKRGVIRNRWHQWRISRILNWIEAEHCRKSINARTPAQRLADAINGR